MAELTIVRMKQQMINECVDLYMEKFNKENSDDKLRDKVFMYFYNYFDNVDFVGYAALLNGRMIAISIGVKKPWIGGFEYLIEEFYVSLDIQGKGIIMQFIEVIDEDIRARGINGMILNYKSPKARKRVQNYA